MKMNRLQQRVLKAWWGYHVAGFGVRQFLRVCWPRWLLLIALCAVVTALCLSIAPEVAFFFVGLGIGAISRDFGYFVQGYGMWPVTQKIIDWERVADMLKSGDVVPH